MHSGKRVLIFHGTMGSPSGNWFPWLKEKLCQEGAEVLIPSFPTPNNQSLNTWFDALSEAAGGIKTSDILVGHSTGALFALRVLEKAPHKIHATFIVSGFSRILNLEPYDTLNKTFLEPPFRFDKITSASEKIFTFSGDNDPYVPIEYGEELATSLGITPCIIKNGGHLNSESGFTEFPELLEAIIGI